MILIEAGERSEKAHDAKVLFASQLAARGYAAGIDEATIPDGLDRNQKYEIAPLLVEMPEQTVRHLIIIGAETISDETLMLIRGYALDPSVQVAATGRFSDLQVLAASRAKIAYAIGREPTMIDIADINARPLMDASISPLLAVGGNARPVPARPQVFVFVPPEMIEEPMTLPILSAMDQLPGVALNLITTGKSKEQIRASRHGHLSVFGYTEMTTTAFAELADIVAFFGESIPGERMAALALDMMRAGKVVIDCTGSSAFVARGAPALRGPADLAALPNYLDHTVLINLAEIGKRAGDSPWLNGNSIERLEKALGLRPSLPAETPARRPMTVFVPTNGNGLGHAQRCSLIAAEMPARDDCVFAAFPSCVSMVESKGFACLPLVQRSDDHPEEYANDVLNYLRLRRAVRPGDRLVFDGGYVFDSIYRTIKEKRLSAAWIRRGLWLPGQMNPVSLDREKAFEAVIVPTEAFEELNTSTGYGRNTHHVGPVVQQLSDDGTDSEALRARLADRFKLKFDQLVVTMLGGGVAADRSAQLQTLCNLLERRDGCLHLIVVWPGSRVSPAVYGWKRSRPVQTKAALALAAAADLTVSAAGYNSFHEILYHGIPAIFVPQMAAYMDDQQRRAQAAADRGLAVSVLASEMLLLEREVTAFLDKGKAADIRKNLKSIALPAPGNAAAAALIGRLGHE
ncbi:MAG: hypothetical protein KDE08_07880 [Rhodobacteraceae bacterium]|nr:hypothetical protein [Paracoccaceae bacterium]